MAVSIEPSVLDFQGHMESILRHLDIESGGDSVTLRLREDYDGKGLLEGFAAERGVTSWNPLLLAQALAGFKNQVGGDAGVVAVGSDFIELSQSKCEFGEPREGKYRGNLCEVCIAVMGAAARSSGIAEEALPEVSSSIAAGDRACTYTVMLR